MDLTLFFVDSLRKLLSTEIGDFEFLRDITQLRKVLCCTVCGNLLSDDPLLIPEKCHHFICKNCIRRQDRETYCDDCSDWDKYDSDPTLSCFVATYKAFCEFVLRSDEMLRILHLNPDCPLFDIVKEGSLRDSLEKELVFQNSMGVSNDNYNSNLNGSEETMNETSNSMWIKQEEGTSSSSNTSKSPDTETEFRFRKQTWPESSSQTLDLSIVGTVVQRVDESAGPVKKLKVRLPKQKTPPKIRRGCRCGNAAAVPGKLTCCGQRCPCYVDARACFDCRCKGCRNPHLPGGKKLLQGINTLIDTKSNLTVQLQPTTSSSSASPSQLFSSGGSIYPNFARFSLPLPIISMSQSKQHPDQKPLY